MADDQPTHEEWRPVVGYEGLYEVSSIGRVRSHERTVFFTDMRVRTWPATIRKTPLSHGYPSVNLTDNDGNHRTRPVHRLVAEAFIGPILEGMVVRHLNDVPTDNRLENLAIGTQSENILDCVRNGNHHLRSMTHCRRGHEFTRDNTYMPPGTKSRVCRKCAALRSRRYKAARGDAS